MGTSCRKMQEVVHLGISKVMGRVRADNRAVGKDNNRYEEWVRTSVSSTDYMRSVIKMQDGGQTKIQPGDTVRNP